jgi:hypothetical protein
MRLRQGKPPETRAGKNVKRQWHQIREQAKIQVGDIGKVNKKA